MSRLLLGVNVDHVATIRQARGVTYPDPVEAARLAERAGADGITAHLREDRRHISDDDVARLRAEIATKLNLEMAATDEMCAIAIRTRPRDVCLVPERREELTTEGGLDVVANRASLAPRIARLAAAGIRVSLFVDPDEAQLAGACELGAPVVELHTGAWANAKSDERDRELDRLRRAAREGRRLGLEVNAGHGLTVSNTAPVAAIPEIVELNIGHSIVARAVIVGIEAAVREIRAVLDGARA